MDMENKIMARNFRNSRLVKISLAAWLLAGTATGVQAQMLGYDDEPAAEDGSDVAAPADAEPTRKSRRGRDGDGQQSGPRVDITPYLEVQQILTADLKNGGDVLTYSTVAAGIDAAISTRRAEGQLSVRYERRIGWDESVADENVISGVARGRVNLTRGLSVEAGALASRSRLDGRGSAPGVLAGDASNTANIYSGYVGPTLSTQVGDLQVNGAYRFGYTKVEAQQRDPLLPGQPPLDVYDDSTNHLATASIGMQPGPLPIGWSISGSYEREDAGQLAQRYEGKYVRGDVTLPINSQLALVGGVGYEKIELSQKDALRDANGVPITGTDGRFVTDPASARLLSYETDGLIWDAGVMWRPSPRTTLQATVGKRYNSTTYTGSFSYQANHGTTVQIGVYDGINSFGRQLRGGLANLPTQFDVYRNPIDGGIGSCVFGQEGGGCLAGQFGSIQTANFRNRGIAAVVSKQAGAWNLGLGAGYDRRRYLAPALLGQFGLNGITDETYYASAFIGTQIDENSRFDSTVFASYTDNGLVGAPNVLSTGATAGYYRNFSRRLTGSAAVALTSFDQDGVNSELLGSATLGLRYSF